MSAPGAATSCRRRRAFTLVEVMVVVVIIAILATVVAPSLVNAVTPLPSTISTTLEIDMRRARIEAIGRIKPVVLVVGAERDRWWLAEEATPGSPIDGTVRIFGFGSLNDYAGYGLALDIDGGPAATGDATAARFDTVGTRDDATVTFGLIAPLGPKPVGSWKLLPQRTKFVAAEGG